MDLQQTYNMSSRPTVLNNPVFSLREMAVFQNSLLHFETSKSASEIYLSGIVGIVLFKIVRKH